jgi:hypothetical protein
VENQLVRDKLENWKQVGEKLDKSWTTTWRLPDLCGTVHVTEQALAHVAIYSGLRKECLLITR